MSNQHQPGEWYYRKLPHFDAQGLFQMITYRLADSLPKNCVVKQAHEKTSLYRKRVEEQLDKSIGSCLLSIPQIAGIVISSWKFWHGKRYDLIAYVVMPNHVHLLIRVYKDTTLTEIIHSWKSWTSNQIHQWQRENNSETFTPLWQRECWDRYIRHEQHFIDAVNYIHLNPVKAGLITRPEDWQWSSAKIFS